MSQEFKKAAHIMRKVKSECTYLCLFHLLEPDFDNSSLKKQEGNRAEMLATINSGIVTRNANLWKSKI